MSDEHPNCLIGRWGGECRGRIFGGWKNCPHGWRGRLNELDKEAEKYRSFLAIWESRAVENEVDAK